MKYRKELRILFVIVGTFEYCSQGSIELEPKFFLKEKNKTKTYSWQLQRGKKGNRGVNTGHCCCFHLFT